MKPQHFLELLLLSAIWGASFLFMRITASELNTFALASFRMAIAALTLSPLFFHFWLKRARQPLSINNSMSNKQVIKHIFVVSLTNATIPMYLFAYAAANINAGFASILNATTPLWGALIAGLLFANKLSKASLLGLCIGFIGVVLLSSNKLKGDLDAELMSVYAIVAATGLYGFSANYAKHNLQGVKPLFIASASLFLGAMVTLPLTLLSLPHLYFLSTDAALSLLALGALSTGIAYIFYYRIIEHSGPTKAMMVTYLIPIFGVFLGWLFLQESITPEIIYGGCLILLGVAITTGAFTKRRV
ncbi:MAG: DMT family transporter [Gammaproteobacteria bacterium]|nr:DMT family transporter [Gammaproteobacteria bacterium]